MIRNVDYVTCQLVREKEIEYEVHSPEQVVDVCKAIGLSDSAEEYIYMFVVDVKLNVVGVHQISHGTINSTEISILNIAKRAFLNNSDSIILAHNHPSGDPDPSGQDITTTNTLVKALDILHIKLLDHIIVTPKDNYLSMREAGYI